MYYPMYYDSTYVLILIGVVISLFAQFKVKSAYKKYAKIPNSRGYTGAEAARKIFDKNALYNVSIERVSGHLTDHYDPKNNVIRLSNDVYSSGSVAALGIAAHEAGHAIQHNTGYSPIAVRNAFVPVVNFGNMLSMPILFAGFIFDMMNLVWLGIFLFSLMLLFQIVTLPVEFNASRRAVFILENDAILTEEETAGAKKVLNAAALTYVAAAAATALSVLRLVLIATRKR